MRVSARLAMVLKLAAGILGLLLVVLLGVAIYLYQLSSTLPDISAQGEIFETARTSIVYASDGSVLAEWHGEENRTVVEFDAIPLHMRDAIIAVEDERFYEHNGVDLQAIARTFRSNADDDQAAVGGSTITQQLVKILASEGERTFTRKVREALLAYELESQTDKMEVLETYLNTVYFGQGAYGVESAAQVFFGHPASELTLPESALLAGVVRSPAGYSPIEHPERARERRDQVLGMMHEQGFIDATQERESRESSISLAPPSDFADTAPYFVEYVRQDLIDELGADAVYSGGLRVYTALDPELQALAEEAILSHLSEADDPEAALVAVDHRTGWVTAMVGGRSFSDNQFNLATQARRQPGSAFKPFVLVTALKEGVRPDQRFSASPYTVEVKDGTWRVENYEDQFTQEVLSLRAATTWSVNAVYARLMMQVGPEDVVETARAMGIVSPLEPNPAIALGGLSQGVTPMEMASAYGTMASGGLRTQPSGIVRVTDDQDNVVLERTPEPQEVVAEPVAVQASLMLHDVVESGTGTAARIPGVWVAGKTGTTQEYRDAWFVGFAEDLSCAVWVGYREGQVEMTNVHGIKVSGGTFPAEIWQRFMKGAVSHQRSPITPTAPTPGSASASTDDAPAGTVLVSICTDSMQLATKRCPDTVEMYLDDALAPTQACKRH